MDHSRSNSSESPLGPHGYDDPPPYSETDLYSDSRQSSRSQTLAADTPAQVDDAASSTTEVIYTPSSTPRLSNAGSPPAHVSQAAAAASQDQNVRVEECPDVASIRISSPPAEARSSQAHNYEKEATPQQARGVDDAVREWNDGFVRVRYTPANNTASQPQPQPREQQQPAQGPGAFNPFNPFNPFNQGGSSQSPQASAMSVGPDGVQLGNGFVVSSNGVMMGNMVVDGNGVRVHTSASRGPSDWHGGFNPPRPGLHQTVPPTGGSFGNAFPGSEQHRGNHFPGGADHKNRRRSSSVSSSSSESSIGSLPSYHEVPRHALPQYISSLEEWNRHPDQIRTRGDVKQLKAELKAAKYKAGSSANFDVNEMDLKARIKALRGEWRHIKKQQKREKREGRRQRREIRRAQKRERKEMKRAHKEERRAGPGSHTYQPPMFVPQPPVFISPPNYPTACPLPIVPPMNAGPMFPGSSFPGPMFAGPSELGPRPGSNGAFPPPLPPHHPFAPRDRGSASSRGPNRGGKDKDPVPGSWPGEKK